jgi:uncharacterized membrane protein
MEQKNLFISIFSIVGLALGITSHFITIITNLPEINLIVVCIVLYSIKILLSKKFSIQQSIKWWFSNGMFHGIMIWFIIWTILYNILVVKQF